MLTSERLKELSELNGLEIADTLTPNEALSMARELLTLREAVAPKMAEVDELQEGCFNGADHCACSSDAVKQLADNLRTAILACEKEKQRADEAENVTSEREVMLHDILHHDEGLLGGDASWSVEQWHDYIRSVIGGIQEKAG